MYFYVVPLEMHLKPASKRETDLYTNYENQNELFPA